MAPRSFRELLDERIVLFDGATGTRLYDRGVYLNRCFDELNLSSPDLVEEVHKSYVQVGVDVVETNTFGANRPKLEKHGLGDQLAEINAAGARIARAAAGDDLLVAGAIGPLGLRIEPWGPTSVDEAAALFAEQASILIEGGVDLICLETFFDLPELEAAVRGVRSLGALPIVAQITIHEDGSSLEGVAPETFAPRMAALDVDVVGVNCSVGPAATLAAIERMAPTIDKPLGAQPNAGKPRVVEGRNFYLCSPEYMAVYAKRMIHQGVKLIGGCCGTAPEHIKAIERAVRSIEPLARAAQRPAVTATQPEAPRAEPVPFAERSRMARDIDRGRFVTLVEMLPPRGHDLDKNLRGARKLHEAGVSAINIPDGPRASARMTPMALAVSIERQVGIETVIHYCCRDRNLLGMQSDLLGAHALGLRNVLLVTGDPPKLGDYPDATAVFDVDSIGLANMVRRLNHGADVGDNPIGSATGFCFGVGVNPGAIDFEREMSRFEWKVDAGAEYAITQPVFDLDAFHRFLRRIENCRIPVLAGIWPLASFRNAEFMNNEVPGVDVPDEILERMRGAETREAARAEGIAIAQEMLTALLPEIHGVQISAPFARYQTAIDVAEAIPTDRRAAPEAG